MTSLTTSMHCQASASKSDEAASGKFGECIVVCSFGCPLFSTKCVSGHPFVRRSLSTLIQKPYPRCSVSSDGPDDTVNLARSSGSSLSLLLPVLQVRPSLRAGADDLLLAGPTLSVLLNSNSQTQVIAARDRTGGSAVGKLSSISRCSLAAQATFDAGC